jgi:type IV pilus assembly protein PilA
MPKSGRFGKTAGHNKLTIIGDRIMKKTNQKGFTLIELMIVIAIVGILAAVALPAYQDYTIRAKLSEALATIGEAKTSVSEYFIATGAMPADAAAAGIRTNIDTEIVASMRFANNIIEVEVKDIGGDIAANADSFALSLAGTQGGTPQWVCKPGDTAGANSLPAKYLPANCRG